MQSTQVSYELLLGSLQKVQLSQLGHHVRLQEGQMPESLLSPDGTVRPSPLKVAQDCAGIWSRERPS